MGLRDELSDLRREQEAERRARRIKESLEVLEMLCAEEKRMLEPLRTEPVARRAIPVNPASVTSAISVLSSRPKTKSAADVILAKHEEMDAELQRMQKKFPSVAEALKDEKFARHAALTRFLWDFFCEVRDQELAALGIGPNAKRQTGE